MDTNRELKQQFPPSESASYFSQYKIPIIAGCLLIGGGLYLHFQGNKQKKKKTTRRRKK